MSIRYRSPSSCGLMGTSFNPMRDQLKRLHAMCDRDDAEFERWEWERKQRLTKVKPVVAPVVETVSETDPRIIKRSHYDGVERVWIDGWSRHRSSQCMIHG